jgi:hypothetical protein
LIRATASPVDTVFPLRCGRAFRRTKSFTGPAYPSSKYKLLSRELHQTNRDQFAQVELEAAELRVHEDDVVGVGIHDGALSFPVR